MMHFFVISIESIVRSTFEEAAMLWHRMASLDYLAGLYSDGQLGFFFRSPDGTVSYELHRVTSLQELDARLKKNPQWPYATHEVIPVTKTGDMVRELTNFLEIDANQFLANALREQGIRGTFSATDSKRVADRLAANGGDYLRLMSEDEEPIDEAGTYTIVKKSSKEVSATVTEVQLKEMWLRAIRAQIAHLRSDIELVDYNPVGRSEGILIGKGDPATIRQHIESTDIFPDTNVIYSPVETPGKAASAAALSMARLREGASYPP